jgi:hypothetical protein
MNSRSFSGQNFWWPPKIRNFWLIEKKVEIFNCISALLAAKNQLQQHSPPSGFFLLLFLLSDAVWVDRKRQIKNVSNIHRHPSSETRLEI